MTRVPDTLLVVDDNELNRDMLSRRLRRRGYEVAVAEDGRRALELVAGRPFDLILLDVMMPGLNGLEVLTILRDSHPATDLPVIMATAKDRSEDVVEALRLGANDYVTKPLDFPVVLARVQTQLSLKRAVDQIQLLERELAERNRALVAANGRMARDLRAAARVQAALLPREPPGVPGLNFAWTFRPCDELAGDGLGVVRLDAARVGLYVLDVSGHGVASALLSVSIARLLTPPDDPASILVSRGEGEDRARPSSPSEVADRLNRLFPFDLTTEQYFTLVYGVLDAAAGEFRYASAGHPGPVHVPAAGPAALLEGRGFPIGLMNDRYREHRLTLSTGDRLLLYSDGVIEAAAPDGELFGVERLMGAADRARADPLSSGVAALRSEVERWCGELGVRDDVSVVVAEFSGAAVRVEPAPGD